MTKRTARNCGTCGHSFALSAANFHPSPKSKTGLSSTCVRCPKPEPGVRYGKTHTVSVHRSYSRPHTPSKVCKVCIGLAHRRPLDGCPKCKQPHVPLAPITAAKIHELPQTDRKVYVA